MKEGGKEGKGRKQVFTECLLCGIQTILQNWLPVLSSRYVYLKLMFNSSIETFTSIIILLILDILFIIISCFCCIFLLNIWRLQNIFKTSFRSFFVFVFAWFLGINSISSICWHILILFFCLSHFVIFQHGSSPVRISRALGSSGGLKWRLLVCLSWSPYRFHQF